MLLQMNLTTACNLPVKYDVCVCWHWDFYFVGSGYCDWDQLVDCSVGMLVLLVSFMLASSNGSLFEWSRARGLTSSDSLPLFLSSLLCNQLFLSVCFFFCTLCSALCFFLMRQLFEYTFFLLIKKKILHITCGSCWPEFDFLFFCFISNAGNYYFHIHDLGQKTGLIAFPLKGSRRSFILTEGSSPTIFFGLHQCNMSASHKLYQEWMSSVKRNLGWGKLLSLFYPVFSRLNLLLVKLLLLFFATQENQLIRYVE